MESFKHFKWGNGLIRFACYKDAAGLSILEGSREEAERKDRRLLLQCKDRVL